MPYSTTLNEDIGPVDYTVTRYGTGYEVTAYHAAIGNTARYRGKGSSWILLSRGFAPTAINDGRMIWRLAEIAAELEASER